MSEEGKATNNESKELSNLQMIEKLKGSDELNTLLKNSNESYWKENIGGELKTVYSNIDNGIKDVLGLDKPDDIKTSDWVKQNLSKLGDLKKELDALKSKGDTSEAQTKLWNDKFSKLKGELETTKTALEAEKTNSFNNNINNHLDNFLVGKTFKPSYSEDDVNTLVSAKKAKIVANTKTLDNGKLAVINPEDGKYYMNTLGEPLTPTQVAELEFATMFHTAKKGGATPTNQTPANIEGDVLVVDMNKIKSKSDFYKLFASIIAPKGLASHDEEYLKIQRATMAHYNINELPM